MSDEITTNTETATEAIEATETEPQGSAGTDWKAEARKWEARAKADHDAANKWREYETSQKTDYERLADELATAKAEASEASTKLLKHEIAAQRGIPADALTLLHGSTREELETAADALLALIANQSKPVAPKPDTNQGKPATAGISAADQFAAALSDIL